MAAKRWAVGRLRPRWLVPWGALAALTVLVEVNATAGADRAITVLLQTWHPEPLVAVMRGISWFGYPPQALLLPVCVALGFALARQLRGVMAMGAVGAGALILAALKGGLAIGRPSGVHRYLAAGGYGYPSGHAYLATVLLVDLLAVPWARRRPWTVGLAVALIALVDGSRVFLGDHWTSQVLAGDALGTGVALLVPPFGPGALPPARTLVV